MDALISKARELSHRRIVWTAQADKFAEEVQPLLNELANALENERKEPRTGCLGCPMVDGKCPHCGNEAGPP